MAQSGQPPQEPDSSLLLASTGPDDGAALSAPHAAEGATTVAEPSTVSTAGWYSSHPAVGSVPTTTELPMPPTPPPINKPPGLLRRFFHRVNGGVPSKAPVADPREEDDGGRSLGHDTAAAVEEPVTRAESEEERDEEGLDPDDPRMAPIRRIARQVVPGLPRALTFKRQQSELRDNLVPAELSAAERRGLSIDRRMHSLSQTQTQSGSDSHSLNRSSADVSFASDAYSFGGGAPPPSGAAAAAAPSAQGILPPERMLDTGHQVGPPMAAAAAAVSADYRVHNTGDGGRGGHGPADETYPFVQAADSVPPQTLDTLSMTTTQFERVIHEDLEKKWILNLSMLFRDRSRREKFFVTYRQHEHLWRRVTISLDYRSAPDGSLEMDLDHTRLQREKNAKIYEAIRESLQDIQFYQTVTNLKLQTTDGRLHVHVVEDVNEIIPYPALRTIQHLRCRRVRESEIEFDAHMSGFVYKVRVHGATLIKKEIPGPDTVDEFLYEVNALTQLQGGRSVIGLYGVVVDDNEEHVRGLLIDYAESGALVDLIYDHDHALPWPRREKWARQIVEGLAEIHEAGFVQGDFTLSNIVVDRNDDAKIIDINRRGCPVGWEPPEATPLIQGGQRIHMYIGVKSDLFQLGMVLWALAAQEDEPEAAGRPLRIPLDADCPSWFRTIVETCLAEDPRQRAQALYLRGMFPDVAVGPAAAAQKQRRYHTPSLSVASSGPIIKTVNSPPPDWSFQDFGGGPQAHPYAVGGGHPGEVAVPNISHGPYYFTHHRGRSPPSPMHSSTGGPDSFRRYPAWSAYSYDQSRTSQGSISVDDMDEDDDQSSRRRDYGRRRLDSDAQDRLGVGMPDVRSLTPRTNTESVPAGVLAPRVAFLSASSEIGNEETPRAEEPKFLLGLDTPPRLPPALRNEHYHPERDAVPAESEARLPAGPEAIALPRSPFEDRDALQQESAASEVEGLRQRQASRRSPVTTTVPEAIAATKDLCLTETESEKLTTRDFGSRPCSASGLITVPDLGRNDDSRSSCCFEKDVHHTLLAPLDTASAIPTWPERLLIDGGSGGGTADSHRAENGSSGHRDADKTRPVDMTPTSQPAYDTTDQPQQQQPQQSVPRRLPSNSPTSPVVRASPVSSADLPADLKGIGAAYDQADEEAVMRTHGTTIDDDDLGIPTTPPLPPPLASAGVAATHA